MTRIRYAAQLITFNEGRMFRAAKRLDNGSNGTTPGWPAIRGPTSHWHLRAVLDKEVVFDVGDDTPWGTSIIHATAIHESLEALGIPHWVALSGGKGMHIHVMCKPHPWADDDQWRFRVARYILEDAANRCGDFMLSTDYRLLSPPDGSRLVREFGAKNDASSSRVKSLWWQDGDEWRALPATRDEAYDMIQTHEYPMVRPASVYRLDMSWTGCVGAGSCPKGPQCLEPANWSMCDGCPVMS